MEAWKTVIKDRFLGAEKKENPFAMFFLYLMIAILCCVLIFIMVFQLCYVDGSSMNNTLYDEEHVLLKKTNSNIKIGDIVVITKSYNNGEQYNIIKRVIALPGDSIKFVTNNNQINLYRRLSTENEFKLIDEPYIAEPMQMLHEWVTAKPNTPGITIPTGFVFVMGDNRNHSSDSRSNDSYYPINNVYGKMVTIIKKDSLLENFLKFLYREKPSVKGFVM